MIPGLGKKQMAQAMKKLGMKQEEIPADLVIIKSGEKELVISNPHVLKVNMMGQETFQITGTAEERSSEATISEEDINTVVSQTKATKEQAEDAIKKCKGDLALAIMELSK